jgi:rubredoxin
MLDNNTRCPNCNAESFHIFRCSQPTGIAEHLFATDKDFINRFRCSVCQCIFQIEDDDDQ